MRWNDFDDPLCPVFEARPSLAAAHGRLKKNPCFFRGFLDFLAFPRHSGSQGIAIAAASRAAAVIRCFGRVASGVFSLPVFPTAGVGLSSRS